jgi:hypothetical protein
MGFFSKIAEWIAPAVKAVRKVVEVVDDWVNGTPMSRDYAELTRQFEDRRETKVQKESSIDFMSAIDTKEVESQIGAVEKRLERQSQDQAVTNKILNLQTEVMKLAVVASAFDRYSSNIKLHASNLSIHLQTIRNVKGLTDDVNSLRYGLRKAFNKIDQLTNAQNQQSVSQGRAKITPIGDSVDIDSTDGAISLSAPYHAFIKTRDLLISEINSLSELSNEHSNDIKKVQEKAAELGAFGHKVIDYLETVIVPKLNQTKQMGIVLKREMLALPVIPKEDDTVDPEVT